MIVGVSTLTNASADKNSETYSLCISTGDTLWDIARASNTTGKDLRNVVDDIMKLNNMHSTNINVGDVLQIPIY
jgi:LysM repeat protein